MKTYLYSPKTTKNNYNDEYYTPVYAVIPILKYLKPNSTIWCPFDTKDSNFVKVLQANGHTVIHTHIIDNNNFFNDTKGVLVNNNIDYIISNPPYSCKDEILIELYKLKKPFMMLLPLVSLSSKIRTDLFVRYGLELLVFDTRINYNDTKSITFATSYFCWNVLPEKLIFEKLDKKII